MPVHNAMPHLAAAIESILSQTFRDFELFIGDDCSSDGGFDCIRTYAARDSRIRYARSETRMGPVASSNWVANEARAPIVARMDGDDISHPQMQVLAAHPDAPIVGSLFDLVDEAGRPLRASNRSTLLLGRFVPFSHPTIMYRNEPFRRAGRYRDGTDYFEDTDLFVRMWSREAFSFLRPTCCRFVNGWSARGTSTTSSPSREPWSPPRISFASETRAAR